MTDDDFEIHGQTKSTMGKDAYQRGRNHTDSVFQVSGLTYIKRWLKYKPSNDYERGRNDRAREIVKAIGEPSK